MPEIMKLSVVVPAYNESKRIGRTLQSIRNALVEASIDSWEIIVADDSSTDDTVAIAEDAGATIVHSGARNIGATRNCGASAAQGEYIVFIDADTLVSGDLMAEMMEAFQNGAIGGGTPVCWSSPTGLAANVGRWIWNAVSRLFTLPAGSFFFMTREAYLASGGFDESYFVSEELYLGHALKKLGRLKILRNPVHTSPRKMHEFTPYEITRFFLSFLIAPRRTAKERERLAIWYERR